MKDRSIKQQVQQQFGKHAEKYVTSNTHAKGSDLELIPTWLQLDKEAIVLDIATGGGHVARTLAPFVSQVIAADLTYEMLETAKQHINKTANNVFYVMADAEDLPFLDNTFDAVTCRIAPHHFPQAGTFVKEAARVLKPGGRFLVIDNIAPAEKELDEFVNKLEKLRDNSHVRSYSQKEWKTWLQKAGLTVTKENSRKKTFDYPDWVSRTTDSAEQVKRVDAHLLSAEQPVRNYFSIHQQGENIKSITIDEWMALAEKN